MLYLTYENMNLTCAFFVRKLTDIVHIVSDFFFKNLTFLKCQVKK